MLRIILLSLLAFWIFRFVIRFVLPLFRITAEVRGQMKNMHTGSQQPTQAPPPPRQQQKVRKGDYIDYEEIK